ncbi:hypothetical protein NFI96_028397 [Prochilodus magdalenae]|nr:hypothetical protein NFI96_028397 [Prochilodus magdalenae]
MLKNLSHPMYHSLEALGSSFSARLLPPWCVKERLDQIRRLMFLEQRENLLHSDALMRPVVKMFIFSGTDSILTELYSIYWIEGTEVGGGRAGREFTILTAWWMDLSLSLLVLAPGLCSLLPDSSRLKKSFTCEAGAV